MKQRHKINSGDTKTLLNNATSKKECQITATLPIA
jgi:hypothetical protein